MRAALVSLAVFAVVAACGAPAPTTTAPATSSPEATTSRAAPSLSASDRPDTIFPREVAGLPVVNVEHAAELRDAGKLDGQAVAVAGYYGSFTPSCPYPGRYIGPLEQWCLLDALSDTRAGAQLCQPMGSNGASCQWPTGAFFSLFFVAETSGGGRGGADQQPIPMVLIGHAGDPRQWQCTASTRDTCGRAFVVDRVAWSGGHDVPLVPPPSFAQPGGRQVTPKMTLKQVTGSAGLDDNVVAAAAVPADAISGIDPRWNRAGKNLLWVVRSVGPPATSDAETRPETVWLIDDATENVIASQPMALSADYQPAQLWLMATLHGTDCCNNLAAIARMMSADGSRLYDDVVSGGASGGSGYTTFGGGYGSQPVVVPEGMYTVTIWLAKYDVGTVVAHAMSRTCSTPVAVRAGDSETLNADFQAKGACTLKPTPSPTS